MKITEEVESFFGYWIAENHVHPELIKTLPDRWEATVLLVIPKDELGVFFDWNYQIRKGSVGQPWSAGESMAQHGAIVPVPAVLRFTAWEKPELWYGRYMELVADLPTHWIADAPALAVAVETERVAPPLAGV